MLTFLWPVVLAVAGCFLFVAYQLRATLAPFVVRTLGLIGLYGLALTLEGATRADGFDLYALSVPIAVLGGAWFASMFLPAKAFRDEDGDGQPDKWSRLDVMVAGLVGGGLIAASVIFAGKVPRDWWFACGGVCGAFGWSVGPLIGTLGLKISRSRSLGEAADVLRPNAKKED